jgi:hypothetical protein
MAATGMARVGISPHVVERHFLNHSTGTLIEVAGFYNRFGYLLEMQAALQISEATLQHGRNPAYLADHVAFSDASRQPIKHFLLDPTHACWTEANALWKQARLL